MNRVVITGIGVVSALGRDAPAFWAALTAGTSGIGRIRAVDAEHLRYPLGAEAGAFDPAEYFDEKSADLLDRFAQFALVAAREAVADAGIAFDPELGQRSAVITGSGGGGNQAIEAGYDALFRQGQPRVHPFSIPRIMSNAGASHIATEFGITGPTFTLSTACASSAHAIGLAFWMLRSGQVDRAICGGSEAPFTLGNLKAWEALRVQAPDACRPFSRERRGMILGEGGAMLVLESLAQARARKAAIHAEIVGCGMSADAGHITQSSVAGPTQAMRGALADGGLTADDIGYINAHGTGTPANDQAECEAIQSVFGPHAQRLAVSSTKAAHGHTLGAAGAIEAAATLFALRDQIVPPTLNYGTPDPACGLDVVPNQARRLAFQSALSNSFAFGGLNVSLAFRRWDET